MHWLYILVISFSATISSAEEVDTTLLILDSMVDMMLGEGQYDRNYYQKLKDCMNMMDVLESPASDAAWQGIIDYWDMGGTEDDPWGGAGSHYIEDNQTVTNIHGMLIYEPCDYTSNVAYYVPATEICDRFTDNSPLHKFSLSESFIQSFVRGYVNLAVGSSFMHGTNTNLGGQQDVRNLAALAYQIHQASLAAIPRNPILHDISTTPRSQTAFEMITEFSDMFLNKPVEEWYRHTNEIDVPNYYLTYTAIFTTVLDLLFEPDFVDPLIPILSQAFGVPTDYVEFIEDLYLPELRNYTSTFELNKAQKATFFVNSIGTASKLIYAFLWQEEVLTDSSILLTPEANAIGWNLLPTVNTFLGSFQTFPYYYKDFQIGLNVYPGDFNCNPVIPHAKWHLESAIGMLDLTYLADQMNSIFESHLDL